MRVLQVIDTLNIGGAERMLVTISNLLRERNIDVEVLLINSGGPLLQELDNNIQVHRLRRTNKYSPLSLYKVHTICSGFNIVHVHMRHCYAYMRLAQLVFGGKYKIVLHDHYGDIAVNKSIPLSLKGLFKPKHYIGVSQSLVDWAQRSVGIASSKCHLLVNTIQPHSTITHKKANNGQVMMVSNIRQTKNIEFAIDLIGNKLTIYGNIENPEYFDSIKGKSEAAGSKLQQGITVLSEEYNQYDLAIHTSRSETGPLVLLEYLANGMPFLAYNTGAVAELLANELPQHFVDSFHKEEWLSKIDALLHANDYSYLKATFQKYFSPDKYIDQCLGIYASANSW